MNSMEQEDYLESAENRLEYVVDDIINKSSSDDRMIALIDFRDCGASIHFVFFVYGYTCAHVRNPQVVPRGSTMPDGGKLGGY